MILIDRGRIVNFSDSRRKIYKPQFLSEIFCKNEIFIPTSKYQTFKVTIIRPWAPKLTKNVCLVVSFVNPDPSIYTGVSTLNFDQSNWIFQKIMMTQWKPYTLNLPSQKQALVSKITIFRSTQQS